MTAGVRAAAVYARFSSDIEGSGLGVARQLDDCRRLAQHLGWPVAHEYVDNDLSAFSGKRRPAYEQLLADLADGLRDAVLCYHVDRLTAGRWSWSSSSARWTPLRCAMCASCPGT